MSCNGDIAKADTAASTKHRLGPLCRGEYDVVIPVTSGGLMINIGELRGVVVFCAYRRFEDGTKGPAERHNLIRSPLDRIIAVDGVRVGTFVSGCELFRKSCKCNKFCHVRLLEHGNDHVSACVPKRTSCTSHDDRNGGNKRSRTNFDDRTESMAATRENQTNENHSADGKSDSSATAAVAGGCATSSNDKVGAQPNVIRVAQEEPMGEENTGISTDGTVDTPTDNTKATTADSNNSPEEGKGQVRVKQEPDDSPSAITLSASEEESQNADSGDEEYKLALHNLKIWLAETIGFSPCKNEMEAYAHHFFDLGLHSVEMIQNVCTKEDVGSFEWMKAFHKRAFLNSANLTI